MRLAGAGMWRSLWMAVVVACAGCVPAGPQGPARVIDGDSLVVGGVEVRLYGIDAPEPGQRCREDGPARDCGRLAAAHLAELIAGRAVACRNEGYTETGTRIAVCTVVGRDLGAAMVRQGYAAAFTSITDAYAGEERNARSRGAGLWSHGLSPPARWRRAGGGAAGGGDDAGAPDVLDGHVFFERAQHISRANYEDFVYVGYLWAGVALGVVGLPALIITWLQVRMSRLQTRASLLFDIDKRWEGQELEAPRRTAFEMLERAQARAEGAEHADIAALEDAYSRAYAEEMKRLAGSDETKYFAALKVYGFFETVGYAARKGYLDPDDIASLFRTSIRQIAAPFRCHINDMRADFQDDTLYEHTLWLFDRVG